MCKFNKFNTLVSKVPKYKIDIKALKLSAIPHDFLEHPWKFQIGFLLFSI